MNTSDKCTINNNINAFEQYNGALAFSDTPVLFGVSLHQGQDWLRQNPVYSFSLHTMTWTFIS